MSTAACILLVEDDPGVLMCISEVLERKGYQVLTARDGIEALDVLKSRPVDLLLTDIMMPRMNGYQLHEQVVQNPAWVSIPIVFLSARSMDSDVRYGKELGIDDYLTKPIQMEDLLATIRGRLRRAQQLKAPAPPSQALPRLGPNTLQMGQLHIDADQYRVWRDGKPIKLSLKEFKLLKCLAQHRDKVVPLQELIKSTHGLDADRADASALLRPLVRSVRRKLGYPAGDMGCIKSVRGVGYQLIPHKA